MKTTLNVATKTLADAPSSHPALQITPALLPDLLMVTVTDTMIVSSFDDGRSVSFPMVWSQKLIQATPEQRQAFEFNAHFIFWDEIDEIIGVRNILFGNQLRWK